MMNTNTNKGNQMEEQVMNKYVVKVVMEITVEADSEEAAFEIGYKALREQGISKNDVSVIDEYMIWLNEQDDEDML
jgi:hypothetical protein